MIGRVVPGERGDHEPSPRDQDGRAENERRGDPGRHEPATPPRTECRARPELKSPTCVSLEARPSSTRAVSFICAWSCGICLRAWLFGQRHRDTLPPSPCPSNSIVNVTLERDPSPTGSTTIVPTPRTRPVEHAERRLPRRVVLRDLVRHRAVAPGHASRFAHALANAHRLVALRLTSTICSCHSPCRTTSSRYANTSSGLLSISMLSLIGAMRHQVDTIPPVRQAPRGIKGAGTCVEEETCL